MSLMSKLNVGDRIKFQAATRWNCSPVWRVVNGFDHLGRPTVKYGGWRDFVVNLVEIQDHLPKENDDAA